LVAIRPSVYEASRISNFSKWKHHRSFFQNRIPNQRTSISLENVLAVSAFMGFAYGTPYVALVFHIEIKVARSLMLDLPLTAETASHIYDILVRVCGAPEHYRNDFIFAQARENWPIEWRFQGKLGFGGKFWRNNGRKYVNCYPEDETPKRLEIIRQANEQLKQFYKA
jgi:hypothetical protein